MVNQIMQSMTIRFVNGINFFKDFCADECSGNYSNKLKVASIIWKEVRDSKNEKIYSKELLSEYAYKLEAYRK